MKKIFSELFGFVVYDPQNLANYIRENHLSNQNLLSLFTETQAGDFVSENGIILPIMNVEPDDYAFEVNENFPNDSLIAESNGWILQVVSNQIQVIGLGYLAQISRVNATNSLSFSVENGWYEVSVATYENASFEKVFVLKLQKVSKKPRFKADLQQDWFF